jgi:RNA repair pathway DNA polymerase beta family
MLRRASFYLYEIMYVMSIGIVSVREGSRLHWGGPCDDPPMSLRIGGLADLDRLGAPLPVGTEVITRVDRTVGDRVITRGAVGRVAALASEGDTVDVDLVGGERVRFLRDEVTPRKPGLVRYARRRDAAWDALAPCIVIDAVVGSRAWGLADERSDEDRRGVFVLPFAWTAGLVEPPLDLLADEGSRAYWEAGKAIRQALRADPNTLEMLFAAGPADVRDELGAELLAARDAFVSVEIYGSFGRYALSQLERLEHNLRLADHRAQVLAWLRATPELDLDATAARLAASAKVAGPTPADAVARARDYVKQLYRSLYDQGLLPAADWHALVAFAQRSDLTLEPPRDLAPKNAYNLIRLLDLAIRWLRGGAPPSLVVPDALRPTLLAIKRGELPLAEVIEMARGLTPALEEARAHSPLPPRADLARADGVLRAIRAETARRAIAGAPGPWGADAPAPPEPSFT